MDKRLKSVLLLFGLFLVSDFIWGYVRERSIPAGIISIAGGLFSTAFYLLLFWFRSGGNTDKPNADGPLKALPPDELRHIKEEADYLSAAIASTQGMLQEEDLERLKALNRTLEDATKRTKSG